MTDPAPARSSYPVSLDVTGRACLVVGGGRVAARKARTLLECGALVTVIAPALAPEMEALSDRLDTVERRPYATGDAARFRLVVTATGLPEVDGAVHGDAETAGVWVNSADDRAHSSFILPAVHRDGPVTVAVSTSGLSPALASWLRDRLAAECGENAWRSRPSCSARHGSDSVWPGAAATRSTGGPCSTVRSSSVCEPATGTTHGQLSQPRSPSSPFGPLSGP